MENRYFQYLAGERQNEVVLFDEIVEEDGIIFVAFKDGSRCNEQLIAPLNDKNLDTKLMAEVSNPKNIWKFKETWVGKEEEKWATNGDGEKVCVVPASAGTKKIVAIPPKPTKAQFGNINKSGQTPTPQQPQQEDHSGEPVWVMMDKAKKFDTEVPMIITISLPSKSLYNVAKESFDEGGKKSIEYIISNLNDQKLKDSLKKALYQAYEDSAEEAQIEPIIQDQKPALDLTPYKPNVVEEAVVGEPIPEEKK